MNYLRILIIALTVLMAIYYITVAGQLFGLFAITKRKFKFINLCIPFYYWIVSQNPNQNVQRKKSRKNANDQQK